MATSQQSTIKYTKAGGGPAAGRGVTLQSLNPAVATVAPSAGNLDANGQLVATVTEVAIGATTIRATCDGVVVDLPVEVQAAVADTFIADVVAAVGGDANVTYIGETSYGATLVSGALDALADARGGTHTLVLQAPNAASRPDWNPATKEASGGGTKGLTSPADAGFRLDADATLVVVSTSEDTASSYVAGVTADAAAGTLTRVLAIQHYTGSGNSGTIRTVSKVIVDSLVPCSGNLRLTIARHGGVSDGCEVRDHAPQAAASGGQQPAGANQLRWFGYYNGNSSTSKGRLIMFCKSSLTAQQAADLAALVAARYGATYQPAA